MTAYIPVVLTGGRYYTLSTINVTQLTTLKGKGFGTNGVVRVYDSTEEPVIYINGQRFNVNNIYIWGSDTSTSERTKTGIQLGDGTLETSAARGILKNIVIQYCSIGLDLQRQWCNTIDTIHPTVNLKGIVSRQGASYLSNCQIETNKEVGVETIAGGIKLISSTIEGNKYGCILNGSQHSFINCYFEANSEGRVNPDAEKQVIGGTDVNPFYKDVNGGHIICGTDVRVKTLSIYDCVFSNGDSDQNKIYVDKCDQLNVEGGHLDVKELIITKNCVVGKLPVSYSDNTYKNFVNGGCKSSYPIYEINDFRSFAVGGGSLLRLLSNSNDYFIVNGNRSYLYKDEDGSVISYRTSANSSYAREIQVKFNIDSFCDRTNDLYLEADYVIGPPNTTLTINAKLAGSEEKALYGATPTINVSPNKPFSLQIHVPKEDLLQKDNQDNYKYNSITVSAYTHEGDGFVDEATDKSDGHCFKLTRFAINEGNQIPSEAFNNLPSQARMKAHRFIASEGVILPVIDGAPTYNENEMLYVDFNTFKVVRKSARTGIIVDAAGKTNAISVGATNARPTTLNYRDRGYLYYDITLFKPVFFNNASGKEWVEADGAKASVRRSGTFAQKPASSDIYVGFRYFCTDKQIVDGAANGNEIIYKGQDTTDPNSPVDVWVDILGRVVSNTPLSAGDKVATMADMSGKEDVTTIVAPVNEIDATLPITSLTCEVGKYYRIDVPVETLAVTLPVMENITTTKTVVLYLTGSTTPAVTISSTASTGGTAPDVYYQDGYAIEAGKTYEVNCLWNGASWIVASVEIVVTNNGE